jgi:hypothetical protein
VPEKKLRDFVIRLIICLILVLVSIGAAAILAINGHYPRINPEHGVLILFVIMALCQFYGLNK